MSGSLSNYGENAVVGHLTGTAYSPAATVYLALATADPGETATGASMSECANSNGDPRKAITFGAASGRSVTQSGDVTFDQASGPWGTVTDFSIVDSGTYGAGNVLAYGHFSSSFSPVSGNTPKVSSGQIQVNFSASSGLGFTTYFVNKMYDLMFRNTAYTQPATYCALMDGAGADTDTTLTTSGKEIAGTDYARVLVNKYGGASPAWTNVSGGSASNADIVNFGTVGAGGWSQIVAACLVDGGTLDAGNVLCYDNTNVVDQTPAAGDTVTFPVGNFSVAVT
jgi:hypothetical protein